MRTKTYVNVLNWFKAMLFVAPALFFYIMFSTVPVINTIQISFHEWNGASPTMDFVGFANYADILTDPSFWAVFTNNIYWILFTVFVPVLTGLILAVILSQHFIRFRLLFRVVFYMPAVISLVVVGIIWRWIYNPVFGILTRILESIGLGMFAVDWLGDERFALLSVMFANSWTYYGFCMVIFFAALSGIDESYNEAARIEGANPVQIFFRVTLPLLKNTVTLLVLHSLIGSFRVFDIIFVMTRGGPFRSTEVIASLMYRTAFNFHEFGKASAIAVTLSIVIAICSLTYLRLAERGDD